MDTETMRYYYINGLWSLDRLDKLLQCGKVTQAQYDTIVTADHPEHEKIPVYRG